MGDLAGEELEEPVELLHVAASLRDELARVGLGRLERAHLELQAVAEALHPAEHAHGVSLAEAAVEELDVVPDARLDAPARVDELERQVGAARARAQTLLPRNGEEALDDPVLGQLGDGDGALTGRSSARERWRGEGEPGGSPSASKKGAWGKQVSPTGASRRRATVTMAV